MSINHILALCSQQEIELKLTNGELELQFDEYPSDELVELIREHKPALISFLEQKQSCLQQNIKMLPILPRDKSVTQVPLSFSQRRIWFVEEMEEFTAQFAMPVVFDFQGKLDINLTKKALETIIERHEVLRCQYGKDGFGEPIQRILTNPVIDFEHMRVLGVEQVNLEVQRVINKPFDLDKGNLLKARIFNTTDTAGTLLLVVHHIAADGISLNILVREFIDYYHQLAASLTLSQQRLELQYSDYAIWQRHGLADGVLQPQIQYWQQQLKDMPILHGLPLDFARPTQAGFIGAVECASLPKSVVGQIKALSIEHKMSTYVVLLSAFAVILGRFSYREDVVIGTPFANRVKPELEPLIGLFVNNVVIRAQLEPHLSFLMMLNAMKQRVLLAEENSDLPFEILVENLNPVRSSAYSPLFQIFFTMNKLDSFQISIPNVEFKPKILEEKPIRYDLTLAATESDSGISLSFEYNKDLFAQSTIQHLANSYIEFLKNALVSLDSPVNDISCVSKQEKAMLVQFGQSEHVLPQTTGSLSECLELALSEASNKVVLTCANGQYTGEELLEQVSLRANYLIISGVKVGDRVAMAMDRNMDMVSWLLAILKAGACYVPLDRSIPANRIEYILQDANIRFVVSDGSISVLDKFVELSNLYVQSDKLTAIARNNYALRPAPSSLAYIIYTSGTTGTPKGIKVSHQNVCHFLQAMEPLIVPSIKPESLWLSMTPLAFDISVLEIFGSLLFGINLFVAPDQRVTHETVDESMAFSLFFFGCASENSSENIYDLMLASSEYADQHGYSAVWTPERHFAEFGGLFPNPALTSAALAMRTKHLHVRAGSCVLPLNNPLKLAEDWAVVDNLSNGRAGVSFASGWHPADFVLQPDSFENRHRIMFDSIETFKSLWRGESISLKDPFGKQVVTKVFPKPIQTNIPMWLTAAGNPKTFEDAGRLGVNILTHLLGQTITELKEKIDIYRRAWRQAGHIGSGQVSLMIHTFIGDSESKVLSVAKEPFKSYLSSSLSLLEQVKNELFKHGQQNEIEQDDLLNMAFERYAKSAALLGTVDSCTHIVQNLARAGVDEVACLIDFGIENSEVLASLKNLTLLKNRFNQAKQSALTDLLKDKYVTHVQCTPSMATLLLADPKVKEKLDNLKQLFVGGEVLTPEMAGALLAIDNVELFNMYGPTEATVWSTCSSITAGQPITIGRPLAHATAFVVDQGRRLSPPGAIGELLLSGKCISQGYVSATPEQLDRFIENPITGVEQSYLTGDLVRFNSKGELQFLGRTDDQIKLRGFRIELAEIDSHIESHDEIKQCACALVGDSAENHKVVAFYTSSSDVVELESMLNLYIRSRVPDYMIPTDYVRVETIPMTTSGKKDRKTLSAIFVRKVQGQMVSPATEMEAAVAQIWCDLLKVSEVGVTTSFFELGGHSLLLAKLQATLNEKFNLSLTVRMVFDRNTVREQAELIEGYQLQTLVYRATEVADLIVETV